MHDLTGHEKCEHLENPYGSKDRFSCENCPQSIKKSATLHSILNPHMTNTNGAIIEDKIKMKTSLNIIAPQASILHLCFLP